MPGEHRDVRARSGRPQRRHVLPERFELPPHPRAQRVEVHAFDDREVAQDEVPHGRGGRTIPNPQLPMTTVVTPREGEGDRVRSHVIWAS